MKPVGQHAGDRQPESIEFVPKRELDRLQQENDRLQTERAPQTGSGTSVPGTGSRVACQQAPGGTPFARHSGQAANQAAAMAGSRVVPSQRAWMNESRFHYQSAARIAAVA
jgi:hypothetical protein